MGYINIEDLKVGDEIFGIDGNIYNVQGVFPQGKKQIYKVEFSDGTIIKCCNEHLWTFQTRKMRNNNINKWRTETLQNIINNYKLYHIDKRGYKTRNIYVPLPKPLHFPKKELPIKPYILGKLLRNGALRKRQEKKSELVTILEDLQLNGKHSWKKFIPRIYLFSSVEDRRELLNGLINTNRYLKKRLCKFTTISKQLADDVKFLAQSLGCIVKIGLEEKPKYIHNKQNIIKKKSIKFI